MPFALTSPAAIYLGCGWTLECRRKKAKARVKQSSAYLAKRELREDISKRVGGNSKPEPGCRSTERQEILGDILEDTLKGLAARGVTIQPMIKNSDGGTPCSNHLDTPWLVYSQKMGCRDSASVIPLWKNPRLGCSRAFCHLSSFFHLDLVLTPLLWVSQ